MKADVVLSKNYFCRGGRIARMWRDSKPPGDIPFDLSRFRIEKLECLRMCCYGCL